MISRIVESYGELLQEIGCDRCWAARFCSLCYASANVGGSFSTEQQRGACAGTRSGLHASLVRLMTVMEQHPDQLRRYVEHFNRLDQPPAP